MASEPRFGELAVIGRRLWEPPTGVGRYMECLFRHWSGKDQPFSRIAVIAPGEPQLPSEVFQPPISLEVISRRTSPLLWENLELPARLRKADLLFGAYTLPWFLADRGVVSNLGIYESRRKDFSTIARLRTIPFFKRSARRARAVIANSTSTKRDVVDYLGVSEKNVDVVLLGADERLSPAVSGTPLPSEVAQRYGLARSPFFLLVGKLSKRRNVPLLIEAYAKATREGDLAEDLIVVGPDYLEIRPLQLAERAGVADRVFHVPHIQMDDLVHFYRSATAFVLPTEHEGFSLTIPEAMACGTPVIAFDHAALEGPTRQAAHLVEPRTTAGLAESLGRIAGDAGLRERLRAASIEAARFYRWERTAAETMRILARAAAAS